MPPSGTPSRSSWASLRSSKEKSGSCRRPYVTEPISVSDTCLPHVCRCWGPYYLISSWFWGALSLLVCSSLSTANAHAHSIKGGLYNHESQFQQTAAQTLV